MVNKDAILKKISGIEDKLLVSKGLDKALRADKSKEVSFTDFLDPHQRSILEKAFSGYDEIDCNFYGGYDDAERVVAFFYPDFMYGDEEQYFDYPFKILNIAPNSRDSLTHRDYLGALMGLGIKREKIGDILVRDDSCNIIVFDDIADYIKFNLNKVGSSKVEIDLKDIDELEVPDPKTKTINTTVASLRLDCVSSAGFGVSRSKIVDYIKAEKVSLNWEVISSLTRLVQEGDTISMRGKGRVVLEQVGKTTKKGRISVVMKKLI